MYYILYVNNTYLLNTNHVKQNNIQFAWYYNKVGVTVWSHTRKKTSQMTEIEDTIIKPATSKKIYQRQRHKWNYLMTVLCQGSWDWFNLCQWYRINCSFSRRWIHPGLHSWMGLENGSKNKTKNVRLKITNEISVILSPKFYYNKFWKKKNKETQLYQTYSADIGGWVE